jgi:hypothetical protein
MRRSFRRGPVGANQPAWGHCQKIGRDIAVTCDLWKAAGVVACHSPGGPDLSDDVIFVRRGADLVSLAVTPYEAEDVLQDLLEHHPQLLAGYQMDRSDPRRFLLVSREAPVTDSDGGSWRWSIDHLFVDQDAIPTLVEVKRSSDTRIRREVVGQMLDYAANGTRYWGEGTLRQLFERTCAGNGLDPAIALADVAGADTDAQEFWDRADRNLRGGMLRLVFVADVIPDELAAVIEFLNTRMHDTEVYGIEVRRYGGRAAEECFVPRLVGATAAAQAEKRVQTSLDEKLQNSGPEILTAAERLQFLGEELGLRVRQLPASLRLAELAEHRRPRGTRRLGRRHRHRADSCPPPRRDQPMRQPHLGGQARQYWYQSEGDQR